LRYLHRRLEPLIGEGGFQVLMTLTLTRSASLQPAMGRVELPGRGPPPHHLFDDAFEKVAEPEQKRMAVIALSEFLRFLASLAGWSFVLVLVRDRWPEVAARYVDPALRTPLEDS